MTEITRSIEILASRNRVWTHIHPRNWTQIFNFVKDVNGYSEDGEAGVGTRADVIAGNDENAVKYHVEVTEFVEKSRIAYRRYGGPLSGTGEIQIRSIGTGTLLRRTTVYNDDLSEETIKSISVGMETDNMRLKNLVETLKRNED